MVRISAPGADFGLTLKQAADAYHDRHPQDAIDDHHVSDIIVPWDKALGVSRTMGAPPGKPRTVITR